ncbi:MAG: hypothetical protein IAX21_05205 [Candidatus Bathyarchaeota archaeon]|nr:flavodoxin family protein [Candidatus Bathyarchaeum tardum]WGM89654.1 MAG: flavodoxin family protein [Candidatus Bathyarchaeum tardum]WNZ30244.1 MAG: hypothetical protein IAX21_05205 [Candidatus Bathyarchaeota archaeon]
MKSIVLYSTKTGNTKKIAEAIASETNSDILQITNPDPMPNINLTNYDLIFVGTGIRAGNPFPELVSYLNTLNLPDSKLFAIFLTWGGTGKTDETVSDKVRTILEQKNQIVIDGFFSSYGKWNMRRSSRPDNNDLTAAKTWAQKTINSISA